MSVEITNADVQRLICEMAARTDSEEVGDWAEKRGVEVDALAAIGVDMLNSLGFAMFQEALNRSENEDEPGVSIDDFLMSALISAFIIGFETHLQFGSPAR